MRIWIVHQHASPPTEVGSTRHFQLARNLLARGHEVLLIASSFNHKSKEETRLRAKETYRYETLDGVPFLWLKAPPYKKNNLSRVRNMWAFATQMRKTVSASLAQRPDVILASTPPLFAAWAGQRLASSWKIPFVLEVRDLWPDTLVALGRYSQVHPGIRALSWLEKHLYRNADQIVTVLPHSHEHIRRHGGQENSIHWIPNGVNLNDLPQPPPANGSSQTFTVTYAGAHGPSNAIGAIVQSAQILKDKHNGRIQFRFWGEGVEKSRWVRFKEDHALDHVQFHPAVPKKDIYTHLRQADLFVANMQQTDLYKHGISFNKLFDYLAMARPVVLGSCAPDDPIRLSGAGRAVRADHAESLAKAIEEFWAMAPQERAEIGKIGRKYLEEHHDLKILAIRLEAVLQQAVSSKGT